MTEKDETVIRSPVRSGLLLGVQRS